MELQGCHMAVKNAQKNRSEENQTEKPQFVDGSAVTIPTLCLLKADGTLIKVPGRRNSASNWRKKSTGIWFISGHLMNVWWVHSARGV